MVDHDSFSGFAPLQPQVRRSCLPRRPPELSVKRQRGRIFLLGGLTLRAPSLDRSGPLRVSACPSWSAGSMTGGKRSSLRFHQPQVLKKPTLLLSPSPQLAAFTSLSPKRAVDGLLELRLFSQKKETQLELDFEQFFLDPG